MLVEKLKHIPQHPGCYLFKNDKEQIIYVGMSKYLPKRVKSYFQNNHDSEKTKLLVEQVRDVDFMIASSEQEAILLEEELIKLYNPKFNIKGKDDKSRKWSICFTDEPFSKLEIVRNKTDERPSLDFTSGLLAHEIYDLIHDIFPFRSCSYSITQENIEKFKFKTCLEYSLGRCKGPCVGLVSSFEYLMMVKGCKTLFTLDIHKVRKELKSEMKYYSDKMEFEKANQVLHRMKSLDSFDQKVEVIRLSNSNKISYELKKVLGLNQLPLVIEAFDNSHNQGDCNVAASVRFVNNKPDKSNYRKYIIREHEGIDDYASFDEVLHRRFKRLLDDNKDLPNLVLIDGGKGQLNVAIRVFEELGLTDKIDLISISKNDKHKSSVIHKSNGETFDILSNHSFTNLAKIQDEVHRFAIKFHNQRRAKKLIN
jgi:excinuclease ABC subunit C